MGNLGVKEYAVAGGKIATGTASPAVMRDIKRHKVLVARVTALGPINDEAGAAQYRWFLALHNPRLRNTFREMGLTIQRR